MNTLDLLFPVVGARLPTDHAYPLYATLSQLLTCLHDGSVPFGLLPIPGLYVGQGMLQLASGRSHLRLRLAAHHIPKVIPLAGKELRVMGQRLCLGVPRITALNPAATLFARTVTFKNAEKQDTFLRTAREKLHHLGIGGDLQVPEHLARQGQVEPHRHVMRIKDVRVVCYSLLVRGLTDLESFRLQEEGLGGRRHMGGGVFMPVGEVHHDV